MRALARRGLRPGAASPAFRPADLRAALAHALLAPHNVYVDLDAGGRLCARGGPAATAVSARLAAAAPAAALLLCAAAPPAATLLLCAATRPVALQSPIAAPAAASERSGPLRLRLHSDAAPLQELQLWFDDATLALLDMPFLSLRNIQGKKNYVCHECGAEFEQPNPLKVHLFLSCREYSVATFWEVCLERLERLEQSGANRSSAFRPYGASAPAWPLFPLALPPLPALAGDAAAEAAEALATAWGRSRAGHACLYCGKLYSRKYGLKIHIRTHTGYKPLRCRHCLRAFGDPSNLNKHVRLHGTQPSHSHSLSPSSAPSPAHACPRCGKPLARRRDLERHLRARHAHSPPNASPPSLSS